MDWTVSTEYFGVAIILLLILLEAKIVRRWLKNRRAIKARTIFDEGFDSTIAANDDIATVPYVRLVVDSEKRTDE